MANIVLHGYRLVREDQCAIVFASEAELLRLKHVLEPEIEMQPLPLAGVGTDGKETYDGLPMKNQCELSGKNEKGK